LLGIGLYSWDGALVLELEIRITILKPGLGKLIAPHSIDDFLREHWPHKPFVIHGVRSGVKSLINNRALKSLDAIARLKHEYILANLPDFDDEYSSLHIRPEDVKKSFANKMGISFRLGNTTIPELATWLANLQDDLGLPAMTHARCLIYANPKRARTGTHYDQNANFVLQITGEKVWRLAENKNCENPIQRYTLRSPVDSTTALHAMPFAPAAVEKKMKKYVLRPGSLLFVPRGYWHNTVANADSLSLNFTFSQPTWADLAANYILSQLSVDPMWRATAYALRHGNKSELRHRAESEFETLKSMSGPFSFDVSGVEFGDLEKADLFTASKSNS
jgi:50S ribosomal protein L16 3-hydroxylase